MHKLLSQLFEKESQKLFKYERDKNIISVHKNLKEDMKQHEKLFTELQSIISKLNELNCDYSIDECGDIILNCNGCNEC